MSILDWNYLEPSKKHDVHTFCRYLLFFIDRLGGIKYNLLSSQEPASSTMFCDLDKLDSLQILKNERKKSFV